HPLAARAVIRADDLASAAWIGYPAGTPLDRALEGFFGAGPLAPATSEVHSPVTAHAFVQQGLGPALVDRWCIPAESSVIVRPIEPAARVEIWATHSNLAPLPQLSRRFLAALKDVLADASNFVARTYPGAIARRPLPRPIARKPLSGAAWRGNGQLVTRVRRRVYGGW